MKEIKRRLAAIMFTDMVGYSAMMQKDEVTANRLREKHREAFTKFTEKHGGKILQYYGDGTLSIYPSAAAAVECAVDIQRELKQDPAVPLRIGIHTGDISYSEEDIFGDGVNVASRIEAECVPGGIYISGKVYDDIKNHPWLKAFSLGNFILKNIQRQVEIFAIANQGLTVPDRRIREIEKPPVYAAPLPAQGVRRRKGKAGFLAFFFGIFGIHRFYLGQRKQGIINLAFALVAIFVAPGLSKFLPIPVIIGVVEAIIFWSMSRQDFDVKYNPHLVETRQETVYQPPQDYRTDKSFLENRFIDMWNRALEEYDKFEYEKAVVFLKKAAEIKNDDVEVHFMLARCFSLLEKAEQALLQLDTAVAFGMSDFEKIEWNADLAFLRLQPIYEAFSKNGYRLPKEIHEDNVPLDLNLTPDLLDQLNKLQKLRKDGVLAEDEYEKLKGAIRASSGRKGV
jgi:class 3 adenylate cyclase/TM2 domain-containing membrane protein YozV